jgi:hypothetical protein
MSDIQDKKAELGYRIQADIAHFEGELPENYTIAWRAYLAGLLEWDIISPQTHRYLLGLLPDTTDNTAESILAGRD